jgi:site-specific DNA recombinase
MDGCGRNFSGHMSHNVKYYSCNGNRFHNRESAEKCFNKCIKADYLEDVIWADIVSFIKNPEAITEFLIEKNKEIKNDYSSDIKRMDGEIDKIKKEVNRILDLKIPEDNFVGKEIKVKLEKLNRQLEKNEEEKSAYIELQNKIKSQKENLTEIEKNLSIFLHIIDNPSFDMKKEITQMLTDNIIVYPVKEDGKSRTVEINYKWNNSGYITKLSLTG